MLAAARDGVAAVLRGRRGRRPVLQAEIDIAAAHLAAAIGHPATAGVDSSAAGGRPPAARP